MPPKIGGPVRPKHLDHAYCRPWDPYGWRTQRILHITPSSLTI